MGKTKREPSHQDAFYRHYAAVWGEERWSNSLYPALAQPTRYSLLINRALPESAVTHVLETAGTPIEDLESIPLPALRGVVVKDRPLCLAKRTDEVSSEAAASPSFPQPQLARDSTTGSQSLTHWNMDAASVLAARLLDVKAGDAVLDLCAAPGGKSITLAQDLFFGNPKPTPGACSGMDSYNSAFLCCNEAEKTRFRRLSENVSAYLPRTLNVKCTNIDATSPNAHRELATPGGWDKVLVDAPCSSERHIIHSQIKAQAAGRVAPEMANWRPGSTRRLQEMQVKLLMTALRLLKDNGQVLYATCSVEVGENDGVIEKMRAQIDKERKKGLVNWDVRIDDLNTPDTGNVSEPLADFLEREWLERTKHGWIVLPDHPRGGRWGPLFFTRLSKVYSER